ncbi:hypothetical protein AK830_g7163 [Neonectria ditissima]|uniref:Amidoligase enzyme n=1 Tax=Neonectria ditissima TaxID=78410 RepID=A0A0P7ANQ0_9HYPO|nr:hypothetical protein AK830_g7163 [Neonectria ditissima]
MPHRHRGIFLFGFELELILEPRPDAPIKRWEDFTQELSNLLSHNSIQNQILRDGTSPNYKKWTITSDGSIKQNRGKQWDLELISVIHGKHDDWKKAQNALWPALQSRFSIMPSDRCGTHVHVSCKRKNGWGLKGLQRVAKAVVYYERCIDSLMPEHRLRNRFCKNNRYNPALWNKSMKEIFEAIDAYEGPKGHSKLAGLISPDRCYRWNFSSMTKSNPNSRTIEFRQPPGCTTVDEAVLWPQFALKFISSAFSNSFLNDPDFGEAHNPPMDEFRQFLRKGSSLTYNLDESAIDQLFHNKDKLEEGMYEEDSLTSEDDSYVLLRERIGDAADFMLQTATAELPPDELLEDGD